VIKTSLINTNLQECLVRAHLVNSRLRNTVDIHLCDSVGSTNDFVMSRASESLMDYLVCVANHQTEGRGRNGRQWQSPANSNIYMSVGCQLSGVSASSLSGLSLACGVSIANVVNELGVQPQLKWPNDILVSGKKLAGILIETRIKGSEVFVVIGLGLNVDMPDREAQEIDQPWTDLRSSIIGLSNELDNNRLVSQLILAIVSTCNIYQQDGIGSFLEDWSRYDILKGEDVWVHTRGRKDLARVIGVNEDCSLKVEMGGYEKNIYAADVKIKLKKWY
jgi:BirA family transcriptional regulator, biotin operon repressor / biotin---[acetyl-CoA-carboxylase] ligase